MRSERGWGVWPLVDHWPQGKVGADYSDRSSRGGALGTENWLQLPLPSSTSSS